MFFKAINETMDGYDLSMTISKKNGVITVMVMPKPTSKLVKLEKVVPLVISGTAQELDEKFAEEILSAGRAITGAVSSIGQFKDLLATTKDSTVKKAKVKNGGKGASKTAAAKNTRTVKTVKKDKDKKPETSSDLFKDI